MKDYQIHIVLLLFFVSIFVACSNDKQLKSIDLGVGKASWYGPGFHGKKTANGEKYDMHGLTAAHRWLKFGSIVRVTNLNNNLSVKVRINDRGPYHKKRIIDLSKSAAKQIGLVESGIAEVRLELVGYYPLNYKAFYKHFLNLQNIDKKVNNE